LEGRREEEEDEEEDEDEDEAAADGRTWAVCRASQRAVAFHPDEEEEEAA
jgi:hypothetical protein